MIGKLGQGGYIFKNIFIALFCVLGHIDSHTNIHRIFDIFYILYPDMVRFQGGEHCKQQNISVWPTVEYTPLHMILGVFSGVE